MKLIALTGLSLVAVAPMTMDAQSSDVFAYVVGRLPNTKTGFVQDRITGALTQALAALRLSGTDPSSIAIVPSGPFV